MSTSPSPRVTPIEGAAWLADWALPFEGGFTLLSKFAWANSLTATQLCNTVFGRRLVSAENVRFHSRSLLDTKWATDGDPGIPHMREKVIEGALVSKAGRWTRAIATDAVFRFCPHCLTNGYQSALYQIEGMTACPIHSEPLISACPRCGQSGVHYALTEAGFSVPFHCPACMAPLAGSFKPEIWSDSSFRNAALTHLAPIAQWLTQLSGSTLKWRDWDEWHFPLRWHCSDTLRRVATLDVLLQALPPPSEAQALCRRNEAPQVYLGGMEKLPENALLRQNSTSTEADTARVAVYKALRRHVCRRLRGCARLAISHLPKEVSLFQGSGAMQLSAKECPRLQAFLLWRFHFEALQHDPHRLVLRPAVMQWPSGARLDIAAWAAFCLASFYAALEAFDAWRSQAMLLKDADLLGADRENARALNSQFAPLLAPSILAIFPAVSSLTYTDEHARACILIVGPADMTVSKKLGLWCNCRMGNSENCRYTARTPSAATLPACPVAVGQCGKAQQVNLAYFVPMDQLQLPPALDGSLNKAERDKRRCSLVVKNDLEAISLWLDGFESIATRTMYAQQIEKALIWCVAQRGIALSEMTVSDVNAFMDFLAAPTPRDVWLPTQTSGEVRGWSPLRTAPSRNMQDVIFRVLCNLFGHWSRRSFIIGNPWRRSRRGMQAAQERDAGGPSTAVRDAVITQVEWGYITDAAGPPLQSIARCLILALAYYAALTPTEIGAVRLRHLRRVSSNRVGADIWSIVIPTRVTQRREVFLVPQVTALLQHVVPCSTREFSTVVQANPDLFLMDVLNPAPCPGRADFTVPPAGGVLSKWLKPLFLQARRRAARMGNAVAAQRLEKASLSWLTNALEKHLDLNGKADRDCWFVLGACKLCPASLIDYLPDRCQLSSEEIEDAIAGMMRTLEPGVDTQA